MSASEISLSERPVSHISESTWENLFNSPTWKTPLTGDHSSIWNCSNTDDDGDDNSQNDDDDVKGDSDDIDDGHDNDDGDDKAGRGIKLKWVSIFHTVVAMHSL